MREKPKIGQILYSLNVGSAASYGREQSLTPVTVTKVGRKYFYCKKQGSNFGIQYFLDSWDQVTKYSPGSKLYSSPDAWENAKEADKICYFIAKSFGSNQNMKDLNLKTLQDIKKLILIGEKNDK